MSSRKLILLLLALVIAGGTIVLVRQALAPPTTEEEAKKEEPAGPNVLVAARDLAPGSLLRDSDLKWQVWTAEPKAAMVIKDKPETGDRMDYAGALTRSGMRAGEPVLAGRVFKTNEQGFLSAALAPGMRAISVKITPVTGVAGLIFPGDRVDVIVAHNVVVPGAEGQNQRRVSETIVANARVLALDQKTDEKATDPKLADVATIEVTPRDAEKVALAADWNGTMSLVLRSLGGEEAAGGTATGGSASPKRGGPTWDSDVSGALERPGGMAVRHRVQIIRGKDTSEINFEQ
ncbi:MAG: Flp pilus assembly protein CpaB [Alphaproteobacteria bacterium]